MQMIIKLFFTVTLLATTTTHAYAFNFGFVRVPDWMDTYIYSLIALLIPFWLATYFTKPDDVPFNQLYRTKVGPVPTVFYYITYVLLVATMVLFFTGMGLIRYTEFYK